MTRNDFFEQEPKEYRSVRELRADMQQERAGREYVVLLDTNKAEEVKADEIHIMENGTLIFVDEYGYTVRVYANGRWRDVAAVTEVLDGEEAD